MNLIAGPKTLKPATERPSKPAPLTSARRIAILKALADPRRFKLLQSIAEARRPLSCADARAVLPISAATLSHHIGELEAAGLIQVRCEGKYHFMTLRSGVLNSLISTLAALDKDHCAKA